MKKKKVNEKQIEDILKRIEDACANDDSHVKDMSKTKKKCKYCGNYHPKKTCKEYFTDINKS